MVDRWTLFFDHPDDDLRFLIFLLSGYLELVECCGDLSMDRTAFEVSVVSEHEKRGQKSGEKLRRRNPMACPKQTGHFFSQFLEIRLIIDPLNLFLEFLQP